MCTVYHSVPVNTVNATGISPHKAAWMSEQMNCISTDPKLPATICLGKHQTYACISLNALFLRKSASVLNITTRLTNKNRQFNPKPEL